MTTPDRRALGFELTLEGHLGPVLRAAAASSVPVSAELQTVTIVRVRARADEDLVDVARRLEGPGLDVVSIHAIPPGA